MTGEMEEWAYYAMDAVHRATQEDPEYQKLTDRWARLAEDFEAFVTGLPEKERELVLSYQGCVEEMQFQQVRVAYFLGKKHQHNSEKSSCKMERSVL